MEFKQYLVLLKRWYWLLLLGLFLGAAAGILISKIQKPVYQSTAKILVMRVPDASGSGLAFLGEQQLAKTFGDLLNTQPVFDTVSNKLGFKVSTKEVNVQQDVNSQIINVTAENSDPQRCAQIANTVVEVAIKRYVDLQVGQYTSLENDLVAQLKLIQTRMVSLQSQITSTSETIISNQLDQIKSQMTPLQDEASQLQQDIAKLNPPTTPEDKSLLAQKQARLGQIQPLLDQYQTAYSNLVVLNKPMGNGSADENNLVLLQNQLASYQKIYVDLTRNLELLQQNYVNGISNVTGIQDASVPVHPVRPQIMVYTLLTSGIGLILAVVATFLMENLGISSRSPNKKPAQQDGVKE
jgi:capsular polysaccharide biosynthesis protein